MPHKFTSLRYPLLRLQEAEYFLGELATKEASEFQFHLNAFLRASRSVTFVLQKSMNGVAGFAGWYQEQQSQMRSDAAMAFFLELRNISQKEGPVSVVGGSTPTGWSYRFAGNSVSVPNDLMGRDVVAVCAEHLVKLAVLLAQCRLSFPFASCPSKAMCPSGMQELGFGFDNISEALGLPSGYLDVAAEIPLSDKSKYLAGEFEPLEESEIGRIAKACLKHKGKSINFPLSDGSDLLDDIADSIEGPSEENRSSRDVFLEAIAKRIQSQRE